MPAENFDNKLEQIHGKDSGRNVVLVVEDCAITRACLAEIVPQVLPDYRVEFAENGADAIGKISSELKGKVAIIITDIEMKPINGLDMARNLKRDNEDPEIVKDMEHVPVFVNSSHEEYATQGTEEAKIWEQLHNAGIVDSFEKKPLGVESVRAGVYRAIDSVHERIFMEARRA